MIIDLLQFGLIFSLALGLFISERKRNQGNMNRSAQPKKWFYYWVNENHGLANVLAIFVPFIFWMIIFLLSGENASDYEWLGPWGGISLVGTAITAYIFVLFINKAYRYGR